MAQDIIAKLSNFANSAQKTRLVIDLVRGKSALEALDILATTPNKAAKPVHKLIYSAISNAEENFGISRDDLVVYRIFADEAQTRNGDVLVPAVVLSPCLSADRTSPLSCVRWNRVKEILWVVKYIQLVFA